MSNPIETLQQKASAFIHASSELVAAYAELGEDAKTSTDQLVADTIEIAKKSLALVHQVPTPLDPIKDAIHGAFAAFQGLIKNAIPK